MAKTATIRVNLEEARLLCAILLEPVSEPEEEESAALRNSVLNKAAVARDKCDDV